MLNYLQDTIIYLKFGIIPLIILSIGFEIYLKLKKRKISNIQRVGFIILAVYFIVVFSLTVSPMYGFSKKIDWGLFNFVPGMVLKDLGRNSLNFWGNIFMFIPLGFLIPFLSRKFRSLKKTILFGAFTSIGIEFIQLFLSRGTDIDDVILNTIGTFIGFILMTVFIENVPGINKKLGISIIDTGRKIKNDIIPVISIIMVMLISVMITGFWERRGYFYDPDKEVLGALGGNTSVEGKRIDTGLGELSISAKSVCVVNSKSNKEVFSLNKDKKIAPASTTKLLTALTVLDYCKGNEKVTVGDEIKHVAQDASKAGIRKGNVLTVKQLLEGLLIPSGNDAAYSLASYTGKKISNKKNLSSDDYINIFVEKMNENAKKFGANNSNFISPDGYDANNQYTTAYDMACIATRFLNDKRENCILGDIVKKDHVRECFKDGTDITWVNTNELINPESEYYYKNAIGLKTGSSSKAGKCLISAANINKNLYIAVVMGDTEDSKYKDTLKMYHSLER